MRLATLFAKFFTLVLIAGICVWTVGCGAPADNGGGSDTTSTPDLGDSSDTPGDADMDAAADAPADADEAGSTTGGGVDVPDEPAE
jgi:hypothetical protein